MATVNDIITDALADLGVLAQGEVPEAADSNSALRALNRLIDQWAAERLMIFKLVRTTFTIVSNTQTYTVGVGGTVNVAWPVYIDHVHFQDTALTPVLEYQLNPLTDDAWSRIPQRTLTSRLPTAYYYDHAYPLGNLSFWPVPTASTLQGVMYAPTATAEFTALSDLVALPPGYRRFLVKNIAVELGPPYQRMVPPDLAAQAVDSKAVVKRANKRIMDMSIDQAALVQGSSTRFKYNIFTGP